MCVRGRGCFFFFFPFPSGSGVKCAGCLHLACKCTVNQPFIGCNKYPGGRAAWPRSRPRCTRSSALSLMRRPPGGGWDGGGGCSASERERGRERGEHFILAGGCQEGGTRAACSTHANGKHPNVISIPAHTNTLPDVRRSVEAYARFNDRMLTLTRSQQQQQKASAGSSQLTSDDDDDDVGKTGGFTGVLLPSASDQTTFGRLSGGMLAGLVAAVVHARTLP